MITCQICKRYMNVDETGEPYIDYKNSIICYQCYTSLITEIYSMAGYGDGGFIHLVFTACLSSSKNRKKRKTLANYKKILQDLLPKYNFKCVLCKATEKLTIDHIKPISKGGGDELENLQIMCKTCNSRKGNKYKNLKNVKKFIPPTLEDVKKYISDNPELNNIDPNTFWKGFNDGGWIDTKGNPVRNWKLKMRTWSNYGNGSKANRPDNKPFVR